jgi:hypothetical protein
VKNILWFFAKFHKKIRTVMQIELPSLNPFHERLCSLDFFRDFKDDYGDVMAELEERNFVEESNKAEIPTKSD